MSLPFTIEADHPRNSDLLIQSIPNCRLRSAIASAKGTIVNMQDPDNIPVIPKDQSRHLGSLPLIPGMRLSVNPKKKTYTISDPLHEDEKLCKQIERALESDDRPVRMSSVRGVPPMEGTLDEHRMKTLIRELFHIVKTGEARVVKGNLPDIQSIDELQGKFLLNPGSRVHNNQPQFEEDLPDYINNLSRTGG